ncbi:MAG: SUMF1/EgtB/PvdO family nonheme iron enzyme [Planctomycetota bacterium]
MLGQGGMGAVILATDTRLDRKVAIKRILGEAAGNRMAVQRFLTEAKAIAALNHPNIVQIYDYGRAKDGPFLIMEYVDGGSLLDRCRESALPLDEAIDLACHLCDGLAKAHDLGIIHRDIKPANVLLTKDGLPKLTDFGLAKAEAADHQMTMTGAVLGTPDFMPPEQRKDAALVDQRSDLWSLAATLYQMVTGRSPKIIRFDLLPPGLTSVLGKALEESKDDRYHSAREFRHALKTGVLAAANATLSSDLGDGQCPGCGVRNDSSRRFCRGCGGSLEAPCLSCTKPMPMWEEICGSCGTKQSPLLAERRQAMATSQAEVEGLLGDFDFDGAKAIAQRLAEESHPKLQQLSSWVQTFLGQIEQSRAEQTQHAVEAMVEAGKHEAAHDYQAASASLLAIPESLRVEALPGMREPAAAMLARVKKTQAEAKQLESLLKERLAAKQLDELLPIVERFISLRPDRADVAKIRTQLLQRESKQSAARDEALAAARQSLAEHDYEKARASLGSLAATAVTPDVVKVREEIDRLVTQVGSLSKRIKDAIAAKQFDGLISMVDGYLALKPADSEYSKLRQSLVERENKVAVDMAMRLDKAQQLHGTCRFDEAVVLLQAVPEARRTQDVQAWINRCSHLGRLRKSALAVLDKAEAGTFGAAVDSCREYQLALTASGIDDEEFTNRLAKAEAAHADEMWLRRLLFITRATAAGIVAALMLVGAGLWIRSASRAAAVADAIARSRWDEAIALEPDNPAALVGRASRKLQASPADIEGAFADLDLADRKGAATAVITPVRAEAHARRAAEQANADNLDRAREDLRAAARGGAADALVAPAREAIARAWLRRAEIAAAKGDAVAIRKAIDAAAAAGTDPQALLTIWRQYAEECITKLDADGLTLACNEAGKKRLTPEDNAALWIRFGNEAAALPHENAPAVRKAVDAAMAAGAAAETVAPLRARAMVFDALAAQKKGDNEAAVSGLSEAALLDAALVRATLINPANVSLRDSVVVHYRGKFDEALARQDWERVLQIGGIAETLDKSAGDWVAEVVTSLPPAALKTLPTSALTSLTPAALAALPPAALAVLPPEAIAALPPIRNSIGIMLKLLPAGRFTMGHKGIPGKRPEQTPHEVTLQAPFFIGAYEVTNAQWKRVMGSVPSDRNIEDLPVWPVTWADAVAFCTKLSELPEERREGRIYRLPTEAEWEYACRAGRQTELSFADGTTFGEVGWFRGNSDAQAHSVGTKAMNLWGLYDMHGNVWEWCSDWYGDYSGGDVSDPQGPIRGTQRIIRGGYWGSDFYPAAQRNMTDPERGDTVGFRVAMSVAVWPRQQSSDVSNTIDSTRTVVTDTAVADDQADVLMASDEEGVRAKPPVINSIGLQLKLIPTEKETAGQAGEGVNKRPREELITRPFYLGVYEVTNGQWKRVMGKVPSGGKGDALPVESILRQEAMDFCVKLSELPEEKVAGRSYRLPSSAEWMHACRAGSRTRFCFGDDAGQLSQYAWYSDNGDSRTHAVGRKKPNSWGLSDMHGNVHEWCSDSPEPRGGAWNSGAHDCCSNVTAAIASGTRYGSVGFRVVMEVSVPK